jgi:hypothetical protein
MLRASGAGSSKERALAGDHLFHEQSPSRPVHHVRMGFRLLRPKFLNLVHGPMPTGKELQFPTFPLPSDTIRQFCGPQSGPTTGMSSVQVHFPESRCHEPNFRTADDPLGMLKSWPVWRFRRFSAMCISLGDADRCGGAWTNFRRYLDLSIQHCRFNGCDGFGIGLPLLPPD